MKWITVALLLALLGLSSSCDAIKSVGSTIRTNNFAKKCQEKGGEFSKSSTGPGGSCGYPDPTTEPPLNLERDPGSPLPKIGSSGSSGSMGENNGDGSQDSLFPPSKLPPSELPQDVGNPCYKGIIEVSEDGQLEVIFYDKDDEATNDPLTVDCSLEDGGVIQVVDGGILIYDGKKYEYELVEDKDGVERVVILGEVGGDFNY